MKKYYQIVLIQTNKHWLGHGDSIATFVYQKVDWFEDRFDTLEEAESVLMNRAEEGDEYTILTIYREPHSWE